MVSIVISLVSALATLVVLLYIVFRGAKAAASKIFLLVLSCLILIQAGFFLISVFQSPFQVNWGYNLIAIGLSFSPAVWIWFSLVFARESYQIVLKRWKYILLTAFAVGAFFLFLLIDRKMVFLYKDFFGDINLYFLKQNNLANNLFLAFLLVSSVLVLVNLESIFRFSKGNLHRELLAPILLLALFPFLIIFSVSYSVIVARIDMYPFILSGILSIPLAVSTGKYLVKSDLAVSTVYIGRRAVYSSIALMLIGIYLVFIGILAKIVQLVGGDPNVFYSILGAFLVIVVFSVVVVSGSVKQRIKNFVDKTFYRGKFDYQKQWSELSESISAVLDLDELLSKVSNSILQSLEVDKIYFLLAQTDESFSLSYPKSENVKLEIGNKDEFLEWLWLYAKPIAVENLGNASSSINSDFLKSSHLQDMNIKVCIPLVSKRKLIGLVFLGEKKSGGFYTGEELILLEAVAHQLAIAILSAKMSEELLISKEMESFHKLSSFVVHDLKNSISMLSMLLQNAKNNMNDPNFQKTALLTVSDAVERMTGLVSKISSPPEQMQLNLDRCDLGKAIQEIAQDMNLDSFPKIEFSWNIEKTIPIRIDRSQISKVLQNIVINAVEAMPQGGKIDIALCAEGPFACLKVSDSGAGMSKEFVQHKLFKPFVSTKKKGLGIGLYQCKEIVEAHNGKIEVESAKGKGTTFKIKLPIDE